MTTPLVLVVLYVSTNKKSTSKNYTLLMAMFYAQIRATNYQRIKIPFVITK